MLSASPGFATPTTSRRTYHAADASHPHNDPSFTAADDADARANGVRSPYGFVVSLCLFINYTLDSGALGLPNAFVKSGWLLSTFTLLGCAVMASITCLYSIEAMARTTGLLEWKERQDRMWRRKARIQERKRLNGTTGVSLTPSLAPTNGGIAVAEDDVYSDGEVEDEQEVLADLGASLRVNRALNPEAKKYGRFAQSPLVTPMPTPRVSNSDAEAALLFQPPPLLSLGESMGPSLGTVASATDGTSLSGYGSVASAVASAPGGGVPRHSRRASDSTVLGMIERLPSALPPPPQLSSSPQQQPASAVDERSSLLAPPLSSGPHTPSRSPAARRGYPLNSPAHHPEHISHVLHNKPIHHLSYRRTDYTLMSQLFGGRRLMTLTQFSIAVFSFVSLWVTAAIFSQSIDTLFFQYVRGEECNIYDDAKGGGSSGVASSCTLGYYGFTVLFAVVSLWLSLKDLEDTTRLQGALTAYRFLAFFAMAATCLVASIYPQKHPDQWSPFKNAHASSVPDADWSQFDSIFTISVFSLMVQYNLPDLLQPLRTPYKRTERHVFGILCGGMVSCICLYLILGLICSLTLGDSTYPLISLNWSHYTGFEGGWGEIPRHRLSDGSHHEELEARKWWAEFVKLGIMLFPPISSLSVFPLVAISLSENILSSVPTSLRNRYSDQGLKRTCRLAACIPPLCLALLCGQVDLIFKVAGFVAFLLQLVIPCLLQLTSIHYCIRIWGPGSEHTPFSIRVLSNRFSVCCVLALSLAACAYCLFVMATEKV